MEFFQIQDDELIDKVNEQDQIIGQQLRSEFYKNKQNHCRVINAFIINAKGQFWIPRRTRHKKLFPLSLDVSVGGHVLAGETYQKAFARELLEELNIDISEINYQIKAYLTPKQNVSAFMYVYEIYCDESPDYNKADFFEYFWLYPQEIIQKIENGDQAKNDLLKILKECYHY